MRNIMNNPVINLAIKLVNLPSISPKDYGCQKILISRLKKVGFLIEEININKTSNFFAYKNGSINKKTMLFIGHTDVVGIGKEKDWIYHPFKATIKNSTLFGRGISDMKGAISAMIIATENFIKQYPDHKNRIAFLITSDEESDGTDGTIKVVEKLIKRQEKIDYCLIGEPTSEIELGDTIKNGRRGSLNGHLIVHGISGHVAYANLAENPIHKSLPFLNELILTKWDNGNKNFSETQLQITNLTVHNNTNNIIPRDCSIKFNFRFSNSLTDELIKNKFLNILDYYKIKYSISWQTSGLPFLSKNGKFINTVIDCIKNVKKINTKISTDGGTSDGRFISKMGVEIVELGLLNTTIHKNNECAKVSDLKMLSLIYQLILKKVIY